MTTALRINPPKLPWHGGCQCGAVRYTLEANPLTLYACHCSECQHQSSSAFGMSMWVEREALDIKSECGSWIRDEGKRTQVEGLFCTSCGSRLLHRRDADTGTVSLKAGTLDDRSWLQPVGHIWTGSKQQWVALDENLLIYSKQPPDDDELIAAWRAATG